MPKMKPTKPAKKVYRVMIVDDHPVVRHGLAQLLSNEPDLEIVAQAQSASEALRQVAALEPDVMLIDVSLPDGSGIDLVKQIRANHENVKMLVTSMHDEALFAERAVRAGAMGYINKQEATEKIIEAIQTILNQKVYLSDFMVERMLRGLSDTGKPSEKSPIETLSNRELEVFEMIGHGLPTRVIAKRLHLSIKTIETHRESIKRKLNLETTLELIRRAVHWVLEQGNSSHDQQPAVQKAAKEE